MKYGTPEDFENDFIEDFDEDIREMLVEIYSASYQTACDIHLPEQGSDGLMFGLGVNRFSSHEVSILAEHHSGIEVISKRPFRYRIKRFELAHHKVGKTGLELIEHSFPYSATAARDSQFVPGPQQLSFEHELFQEKHPYNLVVAHMGNPEEGLCAIYLCCPGRVEDDKIKSWTFINMLWQKQASSVSNDIPEEQFVEEEIIDEPKVTRKRKKKDV